MTKKKNEIYIFSDVDVSKHVASKNGLSYLNWAYVSNVLHDHDPNTKFIVHQYKPFYFKTGQYLDGNPIDYDVDVNTGYATVSTTLVFKGKKFTESLPVYNYRGQSVKLPDPMLVNKTIKRCEVKAAAELTGLGISLYINGTAGGADSKQAETSNSTGNHYSRSKQSKSNNSNSTTASTKQVKYIFYLLYHKQNDGSDQFSWLLNNKSNIKSMPMQNAKNAIDYLNKLPNKQKSGSSSNSNKSGSDVANNSASNEVPSANDESVPF